MSRRSLPSHRATRRGLPSAGFWSWLWCLALLLVGVSWASPASAETDLEKWLHLHDPIPYDHPLHARVAGIVDRLLKTSPYTHIGPSRVQGVHLLDVQEGPGFGGARMLASRDVLVDVRLVRLALEMGDDSPENADALLAFVLAHELMHLVDQEIAQELSSGHRAVLAWREATADIWAVRLMAFARFDVDRLKAVGETFVDRWGALTGDRITELVFSDRMAEVTAEVKRIRQRLALFQAGLRFYETGQYLFALRAFEAYTPPFPAPEALHAEGLARLQLAIFLLQRCASGDCPGRDEARGCWPLLAPPRSPRAELVAGLHPVRASPLDDDAPRLVRDAKALLRGANRGYGGSADVFMALAVAEALDIALDDKRSKWSPVLALLDRADEVIDGKDAEAAVQRGRLRVMRETVRHLDGGGTALAEQLGSPADAPVTDGDRRCLECMKGKGCTGPPPRPIRPDPRWHPSGLARGMAPAEAMARLRRSEPGPEASFDFAVGEAGTMHIDLYEGVEWRPGATADAHLVFLGRRLILAQWVPRRPTQCMPWADARVVDQLRGARTFLRHGRGEGQQCQGDRMLVNYRFDPSSLPRAEP